MRVHTNPATYTCKQHNYIHFETAAVVSSAVLTTYRQLLHDCGVGVEGEEEGDLVSTAAAVGQHRILIFCQFKGILDIIENDLFKSV